MSDIKPLGIVSGKTKETGLSDFLLLKYLNGGSVLFASATGQVSQNTIRFYWDNTNLRLCIVNNTPETSLDIDGTCQLRRIAVADATNTIRDSNTFQLNGAYWTGAVSSNVYWKIKNIVSATTPSYRLALINTGSSELFSLTESGKLGLGTITPGVSADNAPTIHIKGSVLSDASHWTGRIIGSGPNFCVVLGEQNGVSVIGGHNAALTTWADLCINPSGNKVGINTYTPTSTLHCKGSFARTTLIKTGSYTVTDTDSTIFVNWTSPSTTITLPTAVGITDRIYTIKKIDASANTVTVQAAGTELIDAANTYSLTTQYNSITIQSSGVQWYIIAKV